MWGLMVMQQQSHKTQEEEMKSSWSLLEQEHGEDNNQGFSLWLFLLCGFLCLFILSTIMQ